MAISTSHTYEIAVFFAHSRDCHSLLVSCDQLSQKMTEIFPLNIITPAGVKYRTYADSNATLADLRKSLMKDGIIYADAKFHLEDTVIGPTAEACMKWTNIQTVREIRMCRGDGTTSIADPCKRGRSEAAKAASHEQSIGTPGSSSLPLVPLHRLNRPSPADHLYTTSDTERDACLRNGYGLQPNAGLILASPSPAGDSIPFFRLNRGKAHFYTTDVAEKERIISEAGTLDEGVVGYVYAQQRIGTLPLYRLYSPHADEHFYTTNSNERTLCIDRTGWKDQGIACYVYV